MRVQIIALTIVAVTISAVQLAAQAPSPNSSTRLTVIGCVKRSQPDVAGTTGTTLIGPDLSRYTLVNIMLPADANRTNTAALVAENVKMYRLDDSGDPMIAPHVGDKVEITGSLMAQKKKSDADALAPPAPMLKVESLRVIAGDSSSCSN
jgi:hypothetical protein